MLADKPYLQFVGTQNITDSQVVGALIAKTGGALG
jgi:hypothetical protein